MNIHQHGPPPVVSVMLAVTDAPAAIAWYERALGASVLWSLGSVAGLELAALAAGAKGSLDDVRDHDAPWGVHRQGHFLDPFGHMWLVGDRSPLNRFA